MGISIIDDYVTRDYLIFLIFIFFRVFSIDYIQEKKKKIACLMIKREKSTISIDCHNL